MPRLFYGDMRKHETAYRHERADEATNDLILGSKLSAYTGFEDAKSKAIDEIATNYGKFLKALQTKEIPLANMNNDISNKVKSAVIKNISVSDDTDGTTQSQSDSESNSLYTGLNPNETPKMKAIREAYNIAHEGKNVAETFKKMKDVLEDINLINNLKNQLNMIGYRASTGKKKRKSNTNLEDLTMGALQHGIKNVWNGIIAQ